LLETYLEPGEYVVVPITGGVRPAPPSTVAKIAPVDGDPLLPESNCPVSASVYYALRRIFFALDQDLDGLLGPADLALPTAAPFVDACKIDIISAEGEPMQPGCMLKLSAFVAQSGGIQLETLALVLLMAWGGPKSAQWTTLFSAMGYDHQLNPTNAHLPFVLALHASQSVKLRRCKLDASVYDRILCTYCKRHGHQQRMGTASVYALATGSGAIFVGDNTGVAPASITVDCAGSYNVAGHDDSLQATGTLAPPPAGQKSEGAPQFLLALAHRNVDDSFSWTYRCQAVGAQPALSGPRAPTMPLGTVLELIVFPEDIPAEEAALEAAAAAAAERQESGLQVRESETLELNTAYEETAMEDGAIRALPRALPTKPLKRAVGALSALGLLKPKPPTSGGPSREESDRLKLARDAQALLRGTPSAPATAVGPSAARPMEHTMEHTMVDSWVARVMAPAMAPAMAPTDTRPLASTSSGAMLAHDGGRAPLTKRVEEAQAADDMEPLLLLAIQTEEGKPPNEWRRANVDALSQIACSHYHSVALGKDGTTFSWGRGPYGVLGHGSEDDEPCARPIAALKGERVQSVAAGPYNSAALTADGKVLLWGWHPLATLEEGIIHETFHSTPVRVAVPLHTRIIGAACGCFGVAVWDERGRVYTWGRGDSGQLGHGNLESVALPRPIETLEGVAIDQCAFGGNDVEGEHTGFLLLASTSGALFSCGSPSRGQLGRTYSSGVDSPDNLLRRTTVDIGSAAPVHHALPGQVLGALYNPKDSSAAPVSKLAASDSHAAVLTDMGELYVWGAEQVAKLPNMSDQVVSMDLEEPARVPDCPELVDVVCAAHVTLGRTSRGEAWLIGGERGAAGLPRRMQLPGACVALYGGGFYLGVAVDLNVEPGELPVPLAAAAVLGASTSASTARMRQAEELLVAAGLPAELAESVEPGLASLLLADVGQATPDCLRHELRLLRDLLRVEKDKLHRLVQGDKDGELPPSAGTWTDQQGRRAGTQAHFVEPKGDHREMSLRKPPRAKYVMRAAETIKLYPRKNGTLSSASRADNVTWA
jgi:alpha-tubulin suppressor-like RCC1 family protein